MKKFMKHDAVTTSSKQTVWQGLQWPPDQSGLPQAVAAALHRPEASQDRTYGSGFHRCSGGPTRDTNINADKCCTVHCDRASQFVTNEVRPT